MPAPSLVVNQADLLLADAREKYFEAHPEVAKQLRRAEKVYETFGQYLNLTQPRIVIREGCGCNVEVDTDASLSRANR